MKKLIIIAALAAFCGCQTRITIEHDEPHPLPKQQVVAVNGTNTVITTDYVIPPAHYYITARSPLWAKESVAKFSGKVTEDGWSIDADGYERDLSTNAVVMTKTLVDGGVLLAEKVAAAIVTSGGSVAASSTQAAISALVKKYISGGGNVDNATITCKDGSCTISDGCTTCSDGSCY